MMVEREEEHRILDMLVAVGWEADRKDKQE